MNVLASLALAAVALAASTSAQRGCPDFGSVTRAALWEPAPFALGCAAAPAWPAWHLFTPPHREPAPHTGHRPGDAVELPRFLVQWRCTGLLLLPVVPQRLRTLGYVIDQPEAPCGP